MEAIIKGIHLEKRYKEKKIINHLSIDVFEQEIVAIIGPNGAGKTTTIEMLLGIKIPDSGRVIIDKNVQDSIGAQLQDVPFFPSLTALENVRLFSSFYKKRLSKQEALSVLAAFSLDSYSTTKATKLSGGQQKKLAIAIATVHSPRILFLDEPSAALDPKSKQEMMKLIKELNQQGTTIIFTTHDMGEVIDLADRVIFIQDGAVQHEGSIDKLMTECNVYDGEDLYIELMNARKEGKA